MVALINATALAVAQLPKPTARITTGESRQNTVYDKCSCVSGFTSRLPTPESQSTIPQFRGGGATFGRARSTRGGVPAESRRIRREYGSLAAFMRYCVKAAVARLVALLDTLAQAVRRILAPADYDWLPNCDWYPFDTQTYEYKKPGQILAEARDKQQEQKTMVIRMPADAFPATPLVTQQPALAVATSSGAIATKGMDALLTEIRGNVKAGVPDRRADWLIGSSKRWQ